MRFLRKYWLLILLALPFFVALDDSSLWDANEAFYAQTPREMLERGDWLIPHFNHEPRLNKPPLAYWFVALFYKLFSVSVFWERFPMALLAYGSVLALFRIGQTLFNDSVALWGAGIFATTFRFLILSRRLIIDVLMLFCLLWAIACLLSWVRSRGKVPFLLSSVFFGLAVLAKGPVALLPVVFLGVYLVATGQLPQLLRAPWISGTFVCLLIGFGWFLLLATQVGWEPIADFFLKENWGRFESMDFGPRRGTLYYVGVFVGDFFPWSFFFPAAVLWSLSRVRQADISVDRGLPLLLSLWIGSYFLFFSLAHNKQEYYILPLYPAAALWVASYLKGAPPSRILPTLVSVLIVALSALLLIMANILLTHWGLWIPLLLAPPMVAGFVRRRYTLTIASLCLFYACAFAIYLGPLEIYKPVQHFASTILERSGENGEGIFQAGYYGTAAPSLVFYLNRPIHQLFHPEAARRLLESDVPVYLMVESDDYESLRTGTARALQIVDVRRKLYTTVGTLLEGFGREGIRERRDTWTRQVFLITNQPPD